MLTAALILTAAFVAAHVPPRPCLTDDLELAFYRRSKHRVPRHAVLAI
jgi:hypothetical protein